MAQEDTVYELNNIPDDAIVSTKKKEFDPIDPSQMYQVEVSSIQLKDNKFYRPDEKDPQKQGSKYQFSFEFTILDEGEFYGRRLWSNTGLAFNPGFKRGPTNLYKIVMAALNKTMSWEECDAFAPDTQTFLKNLYSEVKLKQVKVAIENVETDAGSTRAKIVAYYPIKKELPVYDGSKAMTEVEKNIQAGEVIDKDDIPF